MGLVCLAGSAASGRQMRTHSPERLVPQQDLALHLEWQGGRAFQGGVLTLPAEWGMRSVQLMDEMGDSLELGMLKMGGATNSYALVAESPRRGLQTLVVKARTGLAGQSSTWSFVPYMVAKIDPASSGLILDFGGRSENQVIVSAPSRTKNLSAWFSRDREPVAIQTQALPFLASSSAFTVETWMRTAEGGEVVLSTWDGTENSGYPVELIIDRAGYLTYYQGVAGNHRAMRSTAPIADGAWHHVAVVHDPARGFARLLIDGSAADSLTFSSAIFTGHPDLLTLGGRTGQAGSESSFSGQLDELRFWGVARTPEMIRSTVFRTLPQPTAGAVFFPFDGPMPDRFITAGSPGIEANPSDLSFRQALADIRVKMEHGGVTLIWEHAPMSGARFEIQRSVDAALYETIGEVGGAVGVPAQDGRAEFRFEDADSRDRITYYRIRMVREGGDDVLSHIVKVGRTESFQPSLAVLDGNFPNPFNPTTTVRYSLVEAQEVSVSVWDLSGQLVTTLWSGFQQAGEHAVSFSADNLPSGTYFLRLKSPEGIQSHPMLLMK